MTNERYHFLMWSKEGQDAKLDEAEIAQGWHWCNEFDSLLVGPEMGELNCCKCLPQDHPVYKTAPPMEFEPMPPF